MITRKITTVLLEMAASFPIVTITGPRQSGKTTLAKMTFPSKDYVSLEDLDTRQFAESDPRGFLGQYPQGAVIDEVQHVPSLLSYIQTIVDTKKVNGMYILTGSNQFEYIQSISQSLAGRTGILKLLPFSYSEIYSNRYEKIEDLIYKGFYPRIFDQKIKPEYFLTGYLETYVERDVRSLIRLKDLMQFHRFLQLCAGRTGQIINFSSLGNELGVTNKTVRHWISILEASYLVFLLQPYYRNFNKRITKAPKLYFMDIGLAVHLLGIQHPGQLITHPLRGELFETFVVGEFLKYRYNQGKRSNIFYFRDHVGNEVDLVIETGNGTVPVEIKSSQTIAPKFFKGLDYYRKIAGTVPVSALIINDGIKQKRQAHTVMGYPHIEELCHLLR
ncbi:MAG: ATP-binding protein [Deltaproteobacteria bacterium]|nr:ATP-binding protein [Deltaproteobacteria bacterium]